MTFREITIPTTSRPTWSCRDGCSPGRSRATSSRQRYFRSDGSTMWGLLSVSLVRDLAGEPVHLSPRSRTSASASATRTTCASSPTTIRSRASRTAGRSAPRSTRQLAHQARYGTSLAFLMLDLDHFKYVNDTLGHRVGDQVIRAVADLLAERIRAPIPSRASAATSSPSCCRRDSRSAASIAGELSN